MVDLRVLLASSSLYKTTRLITNTVQYSTVQSSNIIIIGGWLAGIFVVASY